MLKDLLFGVRMLRRSPGVSLLALLCLTLGVGATTSVLSWIEGILLRPFPAVAHQDRMVAMAGTTAGDSRHDDVSWPDVQDLRRSCKLVDAFIVDRIFGTTLAVGDRAEWATGSVVSANYFAALGVRPILGRGFEAVEDVGRNAHPVTVIAYDTWQERYGGDLAIIGRTQRLGNVEHTIVGVAPRGFYGTFVGYKFQFWVPVSMQETFDSGGYKLEDRGQRWIEGFALLKPGVSLAQAQAEVTAVARRLEAAYPATNRGRGIKLYPLWQTPFNNASTLLPTLRIALAVTCLMLFIACANVGNLLLVRSFTRRHEMTVRLAVGAGRSRLLRQLLTEGLILSTLAAGCGLVVAYACRNLLVLFFPPRTSVKVNLPAEIDWRVLALAAAVCLVSTLLFGLAPAMQASKVDLAGAMKAEAGGVVGGRGRAWIRSGLVMVQVSLSFALLVGAGLLLKSLVSMQSADPGFSTRTLLTWVDMASAGYDRQRIAAFEDRLLDRVLALGGVESAAFTRVVPFSYKGLSSAPVAVEGYVPAPDENPAVEYGEIGPTYLATLGIPLVAGREFTRADDETAPRVAVVNEAMAAHYWRDANPLGKRLQLKGRWLQIVGVTRNSKLQTLRETPRPFFYVPMRQTTPGQSLVIRSRLGPEAIAPALAREIHALDASLAPDQVITMRTQIDRMSWQQRAAVILLAIFCGLALVLAAIGLYGVMSYAVSQSRRELGLRMALGASATHLLRLVMSQGLALTAGGVALGAAAALVLTRLMGNLLFKTSPHDPPTFGSALAVMGLVALLASALPTWRATRTDPGRALRD
jgi:predicted permease